MTNKARLSKFLIKALATANVFGAVAPSFLSPLQAVGKQPTWVQTPLPTNSPRWFSTTTPAASAKPVAWSTLDRNNTGLSSWQLQPTSQVSPSTEQNKQQSSTETPPTTLDQSSWILGIGGGARIGAGEPTYPMVYGRAGRMLDANISLSLRPRYIFGNTDMEGKSNNEGAFQMPLTIDLKLSDWFSPYVGGGIATNTDSTGKTNGMLSFGADISISRNLSLDLGGNYIFQSTSSDSNNRDIEFTSVLYLRF